MINISFETRKKWLDEAWWLDIKCKHCKKKMTYFNENIMIEKEGIIFKRVIRVAYACKKCKNITIVSKLFKDSEIYYH
jgi:ribosomal protein S27E